MNEQQEQEQQLDAAEAVASEGRHRALSVLDASELRSRLMACFDPFLEMGFEVHLIAVKGKRRTDYKLLLTEDGADDVPLREIQTVADHHRLDVFVEVGKGIALYARW